MKKEGTVYVIECKKDIREDIKELLGKTITCNLMFDKWNNSLMIELYKYPKGKKNEKRISFWSIFSQGLNTLKVISPIIIGGVFLGPGISFEKRNTFSGVNLFNYIGCDLNVEEVNGTPVLKGMYTK